jgi:predicted dipeptidase
MWLVSAALVLASLSPRPVLKHYQKHEAKLLVPMIQQLVAFPTHADNPEAHAEQKAWLMKTANDLGFVARDAGKITEIELPAPSPNAPVLGLLIHGDVVPAEPSEWSFSPWDARVVNGYILGRGTADDKGPLVQALLAMKALEESGLRRTHTIRLLVGSEEESKAEEIPEYLKTHAPPDYSLVLDSVFPVVVGEKAWDGLALLTTLAERPGGPPFPYEVFKMDAGLTPSIVPDRAEIQLAWKERIPDWSKLTGALQAVKMPEGTRLAFSEDRDVLRIVAYGKSAHSGVNIEGGRNAIVALARALEGKLPRGGADDLLAFARMAGRDLRGTGLGITQSDALWGHYDVNVGTIKIGKTDPKFHQLYINVRRIPPRTAAEARAHLVSVVETFNRNTGASLTIDDADSYFSDEPLSFDPKAKLVKRLMRAYQRGAGRRDKPAISGGSTYAKRLPNAVAFGMWFPGKPYPGHDVDEKVPVADLERGMRVLIHALVDIATGPRIIDPFKP